jgi:mRNA-degrading endonuclease toxin of MazEF toxin-antitoxin module
MLTLTGTQLAEIIGKEITSEGRVYWKYEDLPQVKIALRALRLTAADDSFLIDAVMPYWLYLAVLAALAPKKVLLNTPNFGPIAIPANTPEGTGRGLTFKTYESDQFTLVEFLSPRTLQAGQLSTIVPPAVNPNKGVMISSSAPYWVIGTVALAYAKSALWVACTQRIGGAIVAMSNDKATVLGTEIDKQIVTDVIQKASQTGVPKRGEIWLFDDGYGEHPGLIISPTARNKISNDVLLVPFTSSPAHAHRHLAVAPARTGLASGSYAQYSNISRLGREQLLKGPVSTVTDELLNEIVRHVRLAIGDAA